MVVLLILHELHCLLEAISTGIPWLYSDYSGRPWSLDFQKAKSPDFYVGDLLTQGVVAFVIRAHKQLKNIFPGSCFHFIVKVLFQSYPMFRCCLWNFAGSFVQNIVGKLLLGWNWHNLFLPFAFLVPDLGRIDQGIPKGMLGDDGPFALKEFVVFFL